MVPPSAPSIRSEFNPTTLIAESTGATVSTSNANPLWLLLRTVKVVGCTTSMKPRCKSASEIGRLAGAD